MYGVKDQYTRLQEIPFSSEQKFMAVRCLPKFDSVSISFIVYFSIC